MNFKQLEQILNEEKNKLGLIGAPLRVIPLKREEDSSNFEVCIDLRDWHEEIRIDPDFKPQEDKGLEKYLRKKNIKEPILTVGKDLVWHETGHWELPYGSGKGCPYDIEHHEKIFEAVTEVLKGKGKEDKDLVEYVLNAFEDFCVNPNAALKKGSFDGQIIFWYDTGKCLKEGTFSPFYEAFVKLNLALWGDKDDYQLLDKFFTKKPAAKAKIKKAVKNVLSDCGLGKNLKKNVEILMDKESWPELASKFVHNLADLIDKSPMPRTFGAGPSGGGSSKGKKKNSGSYFDKKMKDKQVKKQIVKGRYARGEKAPSYMKSFEALDLLYQQLASELIIKAETSKKGYAMPIVPYGHEVFDPEKHDIEKINWKKFAVNEKGNVTFQVPRHYYKLIIPVKEAAKGFPNIKFLIDTSGSMESASDGSQEVGSTTFIPWGDKSKYHYALLGFYGALKYLQLRNIAPYISYNLINFSGESKTKGEKQYKDLAEIRKLALSPQFDGTDLDSEVLKQTLDTESSVVLMLSDGNIWNWSDVRSEFKGLIDKHLFSFIKIGNESKTSADIKRWNKPLYSINDVKDLSKLMIDLTKESYKNYKFAV